MKIELIRKVVMVAVAIVSVIEEVRKQTRDRVHHRK